MPSPSMADWLGDRSRGSEWRHRRNVGPTGRFAMRMILAVSAAVALTLLLDVGSGRAWDYRPGYAAGGVPSGSAGLISNCYAMADRIVPRGKWRSAWVVRHADYCIRNGGR